jgi:hypothetical protein
VVAQLVEQHPNVLRPGQHVRVGEAATRHQRRVEGRALDVQQVRAAPVGDPLEAGVRESDPDLERHRGPGCGGLRRLVGCHRANPHRLQADWSIAP